MFDDVWETPTPSPGGRELAPFVTADMIESGSWHHVGIVSVKPDVFKTGTQAGKKYLKIIYRENEGKFAVGQRYFNKNDFNKVLKLFDIDPASQNQAALIGKDLFIQLVKKHETNGDRIFIDVAHHALQPPGGNSETPF